MKLLRPLHHLERIALISALLIGVFLPSSFAQAIEPGYDTFRAATVFDIDLVGDTGDLHMIIRTSGRAVIRRATAEIIKSITPAVSVPVDGFLLDSSGPGGYASTAGVTEASCTIVIQGGTIDWNYRPPLTCWEKVVRILKLVFPFLKNQSGGSGFHVAEPVTFCIPRIVTSIPFSSVSREAPTFPPVDSFIRIDTSGAALPVSILDASNETAGTLNSCSVTLYPSIHRYSTAWNLSFSRLNPAGPPGTANMTGTARIVGGCFFYDGMMSQQLHTVEASGNGAGLRSSGDLLSFGRMESPNGLFPAQSFFNGFFEMTLDGIDVFNKTPLLLQTNPTGVNTLPFQNVLHHASNCPIELFPVADPEGQPAFRIDSLTFACANSLPAWDRTYGAYLVCRTPSNLPVVGVPFYLYAGPGAAGTPIASASTDSQGVARFGDLLLGQYSIREELPPGYTPITDQVQDIDLGSIQYAPDFYGTLEGEGFGGSPPSLPGRETLQMGMTFDLHVDGVTEQVVLNGPVTIQRGAPHDAGGGLSVFETEMVSGLLTGSHPVLGQVQLRESPTRPSRGSFKQTGTQGFYPCESFIDLFVELRWTGQDWIKNATAVRLADPVVNAYPPIGELHEGPPTDTELNDGSMPVPPRISELQGRCIPGWWTFVPYVALPPEQSPTPTSTVPPIPTPTVTATPRAGDTSGDGVLNADDVFIFSRCFRKSSADAEPGCNPVDDGIVDEKDLLIFIRLWILE